jgi:hypothetical protein
VLKLYEGVIQDITASVENASRALIYCFGGKPNLYTGQEEPLRMLTRRLQEGEKNDFDRAVAIGAQITNNKIVSTVLPSDGIKKELFDEKRAQELLQSASFTINLFRQIVIDNFQHEIPELTSIRS